MTLSLLWLACFLGVVIAAIVTGMKGVPNPSRRDYLVFAVAMMGWFAIIAFGGPSVVGFFVSHGITSILELVTIKIVIQQ